MTVSRCIGPWNRAITDHFYTHSKSERDSAVSNLGYTDEGIVGYLHKDDD